MDRTVSSEMDRGELIAAPVQARIAATTGIGEYHIAYIIDRNGKTIATTMGRTRQYALELATAMVDAFNRDAENKERIRAAADLLKQYRSSAPEGIRITEVAAILDGGREDDGYDQAVSL